MTWTGVVWREAGPYGPDGIFVQQMRMGRYTFPAAPEVGCTLEIDGEKYRVVSVAGGFCHVSKREGGPTAPAAAADSPNATPARITWRARPPWQS
jgi:hypothetical protein